MVQFNLLPDIKLEYLRAKRAKRLVIIASVTLASTAAVVALLAVGMVFAQSKHLSNLNNDIASQSQKLQSIPDIDKILTVQNQLRSLPDVHDKKPVASRLSGYLEQMVPVQASISKLEVDFALETMKITGSADGLVTVNKFVDTLKFTEYKVEGDEAAKKAFSSVVLASFSKDDESTAYTITLNFDPAIFDSSQKLSLVVPQIITTRSVTEKPTELFQPGSEEAEGGDQ